MNSSLSHPSPKNVGGPNITSRQRIESVATSRQRSESVPTSITITTTKTSTSTVQIIAESKVVQATHLCLQDKCASSSCIFYRTLSDYLKTFFTALEIGGGASIELEHIDQCVDLPGNEKKQLCTSPTTRTSTGSGNGEKKEGQIFFLIDVVS